MTSLNELRLIVSSLLIPAAVNWRRISDGALSPYGLSAATAAPLLMIARLGDGVHQVTVAEHLGFGTSAIVRTLDQLCAAGLVERGDDAADHRAKTLSLTSRGAVAAEAANNALLALEVDTLNGCTRAEFEGAVRVLEAVAGTVRNSSQSGTSR